MKKYSKFKYSLAIASLTAFMIASPTMAWKGWTHDKLVREAIDLLNSQSDAKSVQAVNYLVGQYGSYENAKIQLGTTAKNEDNPISGPLSNDIWFDDWWTYSRNGSPSLFGLVDVNYFVALIHFTNAFLVTGSADDHGQNPHGYSYYNSRNIAQMAGEIESTADYDWITRTYNHNLNEDKNTKSRMSALCGGSCNFNGSKFGKNYQYVDFPSAANVAQRLVDEFVATGNVVYLGRAIHYIEDSTQPHHAAANFGKDHSDLEGFAEDNWYNPAWNIGQTSANTATGAANISVYSDMSAEDITVALAENSSNVCAAVYVNDYTTTQVACLENILPHLRGALVAYLKKSIDDRLN